MDFSLEATYYRTALLLGLVRGEVVHRCAEQLIEREPEPSPALIEVVSVPTNDLSALRHALWPLVVEPAPLVVFEGTVRIAARRSCVRTSWHCGHVDGPASNAQHVAPAAADVCGPQFRSRGLRRGESDSHRGMARAVRAVCLGGLSSLSHKVRPERDDVYDPLSYVMQARRFQAAIHVARHIVDPAMRRGAIVKEVSQKTATPSRVTA
jgi:hypothetical protein